MEYEDGSEVPVLDRAVLLLEDKGYDDEADALDTWGNYMKSKLTTAINALTEIAGHSAIMGTDCGDTRIHKLATDAIAALKEE